MSINDKNSGISRYNINFIVIVFTGVILLWGPIEPYGASIRIAYLIILPVLLWYGLKYSRNFWEMDELTNNYLTRALTAMLAAGFFIMAYFAFTADYHSECTQEIQTRDGTECVGDYVQVEGPDIFQGLFLLVLGGYAINNAISKKHNED